MLLKQLLFLSVLFTAIVWPSHKGDGKAQAGFEDTCERSDAEWKDTIKNLQNKGDIEALLGNDYKLMTDSMDGNEVWRFDICTVSNYRYSAEIDAVDIDGLTEDLLERIIFISFSEKEILRVSMYYKASDGNIREIVQFSNREEKDLLLVPN